MLSKLIWFVWRLFLKMDVKTSSNFSIGSVLSETGFFNNIKNSIPFLEHSPRNLDCHNLPYPLVDYHDDNVTDGDDEDERCFLFFLAFFMPFVFMFVLSRSAWPWPWSTFLTFLFLFTSSTPSWSVQSHSEQLSGTFPAVVKRS